MNYITCWFSYGNNSSTYHKLANLVKNLITRFYKQNLSVIVRAIMYPALINQGGCCHCRQQSLIPPGAVVVTLLCLRE